MPAIEPAPALSDAQIQQFIQDGFVRVDRAFPRELAHEGREIMWRDLPCDRNDPATWTKPVIRLPGYGQEPFRKAVNTPTLHAAFDQIVGIGRWLPRNGLGTFPVRFPHPDDPGDAGWHVDVGFGDGRSRHGLFVPSLSGARRANASWLGTAFPGATATPSGRTFQACSEGW